MISTWKIKEGGTCRPFSYHVSDEDLKRYDLPSIREQLYQQILAYCNTLMAPIIVTRYDETLCQTFYDICEGEIKITNQK